MGPSPKKWGFYRPAIKKEDFRAKNGPRRPPRGPPCNGVNTKMLSFCCPVMMVTKNLDDFRKKWILGQKTAFLARNERPNGRSAGRFSAPIAQSGPFWAQKCCFRPEIYFLCTSSNFFVTIMTRHQKDNVFVLLMLLSKLQGGCKSPFLTQKWPKNLIFMLSIVFH